MNGIAPKRSDERELDWIACNEAASLEFDAGRFDAAASQWERGHALSAHFHRHDPRRASSLSNLGIAHRIRGELVDAERLYRRALEGWSAAGSWIESMRLATRARSSLFHLRMEQKHRDGYNRLMRERYKTLLLAGQAATRRNLAEVLEITNRAADAAMMVRQAVRDRVDSENAVGFLGLDLSRRFTRQARIRRWIVDRPAEVSDEGRLAAAVLLTRAITASILDRSGAAGGRSARGQPSLPSR